MDLVAGAELLGVIAEQPDPALVIADIRTVLALINSIKTSGLDLNAMIKAGTLQKEVGAITRITTFVNNLLADKTHGPQLIVFIESLSS